MYTYLAEKLVKVPLLRRVEIYQISGGARKYTKN